MIKLFPKDINRAMLFTARTFVESEPTSKALRLTSCDFITTFNDVMKKSIESGYSFAIQNPSGDIVAQSLSLPFSTFASSVYFHVKEAEPMLYLFSKLDACPIPSDSIVVFAISSTIPGKGLASALLEQTIQQASHDGYIFVVGDCTNFKSQKLFKKHGFYRQVEIEYDTFEYGVKKPFRSIQGTRGVQRMILNLPLLGYAHQDASCCRNRDAAYDYAA